MPPLLRPGPIDRFFLKTLFHLLAIISDCLATDRFFSIQTLGNIFPESCMKIDEKLFYFLIQRDTGKILHYTNNTQMVKKDEDLFVSSIFTFQASRRLPPAALLRVRNSNTYGVTPKCLAYESLQLVQNSVVYFFSAHGSNP